MMTDPIADMLTRIRNAVRIDIRCNAVSQIEDVPGSRARGVQNGIQVSRGASAQILDNTVSRNQYSGTGAASSAGVLLYGGVAYALDVAGVRTRVAALVKSRA